MNGNLCYRNALGNAETVSFSSSYGVDNTKNIERPSDELATGHNFNFIFTKPINGNPNEILDAQVFKINRDLSVLKSFDETSKGFSLKLKNFYEKLNAFYEFGYSGVWRENHSIRPTASLSVRQDAGHTLKSSISHSFKIDSRDDSVFPSKGAYFEAEQEFAGLGGNVSFIKHLVQLELVKSYKNLDFGASFRAGCLFPLNAEKKSFINDRLNFGGPTSIRGFQEAGIGPKDKCLYI